MATSLVHGKYLISSAGSDAESSVVINDGAVLQRDGVIEAVGDYQTLKASHQADEEIGGPGFIVFPGLVNAHHHGRAVSTFQMGACDDSLETWILSGWGRRPHDHYLMTLYTAMQMIESGTTTVMYNHSQTPVTGLENDISEVLRGFGDAGMRTAFSVYFRGQNRVVYEDDDTFLSGLPSDLAQGVRQYLATTAMTADDYFSMVESAHRKYTSAPEGLVSVLVSPSNVQWVSDEFLVRTKELAQRLDTAIHMHLVESPYQKEYGIRKWGKTPVAHLDDLGFLGPEVSFAHSVWVTDKDIELLADSRSTVCHNPSSNLRLKNGVAPVTSMLTGGVNVAMGTDSTAINDDDDMLQEMRLALRLHREPGIGGPAVNSGQTLAMATANAARPTGFTSEIGALEVGRRADLVVADLSSIEAPYLDPAITPVDALLYRGKPRDVHTVMINGKVVFRDGHFPGTLKEDVVNELRERFASTLEPEVVQVRGMVARLMPYVERFYESWSAGESDPHYRYNSKR